MRLRSLSFSVATVLALSALAACGGGGEDLTVEEYYQHIGLIFDDVDQQNDDLESELDQVLSAADTPEQQQIEALYNFTSAAIDIIKQAIADLEKIDPPTETKTAHEEFLDAASATIPLFEDFADRLSDAESAADVDQINSEIDPTLTAATDRADNACFTLQGIADDQAIEIDLKCGE